jgi:hypothetical protein
MVHGTMYAQITQQIDLCIKMSLTSDFGMYSWHTNVSNAFAEAEHPTQIYYMRCDAVFRDWWKRTHPDIPLPQDVIVPVLNNLQVHPE